MMPPAAEAIAVRAQPVPLEVPSETRLQKKKIRHKRGGVAPPTPKSALNPNPSPWKLPNHTPPHASASRHKKSKCSAPNSALHYY